MQVHYQDINVRNSRNLVKFNAIKKEIFKKLDKMNLRNGYVYIIKNNLDIVYLKFINIYLILDILMISMRMDVI